MDQEQVKMEEQEEVGAHRNANRKELTQELMYANMAPNLEI